MFVATEEGGDNMNYPSREIDELNISTRKNPGLPTKAQIPISTVQWLCMMPGRHGEGKSESKL